MNEVIHVVDPASLERTGRQGLEVEAVNEHPLAPGYYFVLWPSPSRRHGSRGKRYFGPFATRAEARLLQRSAMALGLDQDSMASQAVVECRSIARPSAPNIGFGLPRSSTLQRPQAVACAA